MFIASHYYWGWRGYAFVKRKFPNLAPRFVICGAVLAVYFSLLAFNLGFFGYRRATVHLTWQDAWLVAPLMVWFAASTVSFAVAVLFTPKTLVHSPSRRRFLDRAANVAVAAPFVAGAYGAFYGRLNLETTVQRIHLPKLPRQFHGFKIVQLSDIHIGPFMPAEEIRKYCAIANRLKPDLIVLTGDFVTFDPSTQYAVVEALSGLRAPYGIYGCLGNHDQWAGVRDSITGLFKQTGVRILRGQNLPIVSHGEQFNLIGVDFQSHRRFGPSPPVADLLGNIVNLISRDHANILLSHNPDTFPRAAELGIELSLAGHTHGGQAALEFISPELAPSRLVTPYVAGLFQKPGAQLYVNRGIGTTFIPIRLGAPPEITLFELTS